MSEGTELRPDKKPISDGDLLDALDDALDTVAALNLAILGEAQLGGGDLLRDPLCRLVALHRQELKQIVEAIKLRN